MPEHLLFDFAGPAAAARWQAVDDRVMGGVSQSRLEPADRCAAFSGEVSLAQGGGFASVRSVVGAYDLSGFEAVAVRARGDGQRYRLNLYAEAPPGALRYQAAFQSDAGGWQTHALPLAAFAAVRRGRSVPDAPPLDPRGLRALSLMIADEQAGPFRLEIAWIKAVQPAR